MTHPGFVAQTLLINSSYTYTRERELAILCDNQTKFYILNSGFELRGMIFFAIKLVFL